MTPKPIPSIELSEIKETKWLFFLARVYRRPMYKTSGLNMIAANERKGYYRHISNQMIAFMSRRVFCSFLKKELEGLSSPPLPGPLGERVFNEISQKAWDQWVAHQTTLINEYRLNLVDKKARDFLYKELEAFLFQGGAAKPQGFKPLDEK